MKPLQALSMFLLTSTLVVAMVTSVSCEKDEETETAVAKVGDLQITEAYARTVLDGGAAYFTVKNTGNADDALVDASSDVAEKVGLHESVMEGSMMKMQPVDEIVIPAGGEAVLEPGGYHVMLAGLKGPLEEGDTFDVTLSFQQAGPVDVAVTVAPFTGSSAEADDPYNPSYRVVTAQVLSIESALGMRGGLGALLRGAEPSWHMAGMRVMAIEQAWPDVRLELERRADKQPDAEAAINSFESSLAVVKADVDAEEASGASRSLSELSGSFEEVKDVLRETEVDGRRLAIVVSAFVAGWIVLTVASRVIADRRDPKFMRPPRGPR
jgi:copper(I)-binding protein